MIGVFDSGVGGLSVLRAIRRELPTADLVYVADHAAAPYGERSLTSVASRSKLVAGWLVDRGCGVVTVACNTASAAALHVLRAAHPDISFVGMEPAVKPAAVTTRSGRVGVVATAATFQGELFAAVVERFAGGVEVLTAACPRWVELVEAGEVTGARAQTEVETCLRPLLEAGIDVLVLACTHYPALLAVIRRVAGGEVTIVDPAAAVARQTGRVAGEAGDGSGRTELFSTADVDALARAANTVGFSVEVSLLPLGRHGSP